MTVPFAIPIPTTQITILAVLFVVFLAIPTLVSISSLGESLDSLPVRFAAVIMILGVYAYDPIVALGVFLVLAGLYIQRHHDVVISVSSG